jgi:hypothetical protein
MTVTTREPVRAREAGADGRSSRLFEPRGATLEDAILRVWDDLLVDGRADCPVCSATIAPPGRCEACGSELG